MRQAPTPTALEGRRTRDASGGCLGAVRRRARGLRTQDRGHSVGVLTALGLWVTNLEDCNDRRQSQWRRQQSRHAERAPLVVGWRGRTRDAAEALNLLERASARRTHTQQASGAASLCWHETRRNESTDEYGRGKQCREGRYANMALCKSFHAARSIAIASDSARRTRRNASASSHLPGC